MSSSPHSRTDVAEDSHHEPPTSKLPADVLWNIFRMNADMNDDELIDFRLILRPSGLFKKRALTNTRIASQVCALWRQILLASPSIWGRLIDVDFFAWIGAFKRRCDRRHNHWAREVLRRSQDCPLHVKGEIGAWIAEFVGDILDNSWERVCVLDVKIGRIVDKDLHKLVYRLQNIVSRPAKTLQFFRIDVQSNGGVDRYLMKALGDIGGMRLFSGEAPALKVYCHWPQFSRSLSVANARALSNIHTFSLLDREIQFSASHFLRVLRGMPLLETLRIWYFHFIFGHEWDTTTANRVKLPLLNKIEFYNDNMGQLTKLMGSFDPAPGCAIQVDTQFPGQFLEVPQSRDIFDDSMPILSQYGASYFKHHGFRIA
ncbi:hypothetical protein D9613_007370 [Agrocybe pediades]|uniref:F-box domain-containing protein n=1 Tax=Agrocybe pediades TaxID=84607 RepID=A0A8H4VL96_9AGAR|nr:hypothetical protein D9613_007370 [Agrocybe pediades]